MAKQTKRRLIAAFQEVLQQKPLDKINIVDITDVCKVNRMTFHYRFHDLDELIDTSFNLLRDTAFADYKRTDPLPVSLSPLIREMENQKAYLLRLFEELDHKILVVHFLDILQTPVRDYVENCSMGAHLPQDHFLKIGCFYVSALVGILMHWLQFNMQESAETVITDLTFMLEGNCELMIQKFGEV